MHRCRPKAKSQAKRENGVPPNQEDGQPHYPLTGKGMMTHEERQVTLKTDETYGGKTIHGPNKSKP